MSAKNVEMLRAAHESWNRRDFQGIVRNAAEELVYTDHAQNLTLKIGKTSGNGPKGGQRPSPMAASPTPSTLTQET